MTPRRVAYCAAAGALLVITASVTATLTDWWAAARHDTEQQP